MPLVSCSASMLIHAQQNTAHRHVVDIRNVNRNVIKGHQQAQEYECCVRGLRAGVHTTHEWQHS